MYFGPQKIKSGDINTKPFYSFEEVEKMVQYLLSEFENMNQQADFIYDKVFTKENPEAD